MRQAVSGVIKCAWCGSADTQAGLDKVQCLSCGHQTSLDGDKTVADSHAEEGRGVSDLTEPPAYQPDPVPEPKSSKSAQKKEKS